MLAVPQADSATRSELPGRLGRHRARVDREEIAAGRQHLGPAAARRTGRTGGDEPAIEAGQQACDFGAAAARDNRPQMALDPIEHHAGLPPFGFRLHFC
jgi:hypothetical protein